MGMDMDMDMDMDQVWSGRSSSSISFLPLRGWKFLFLCFFSFFFGLGVKVLNSVVGLVVFFSLISR